MIRSRTLHIDGNEVSFELRPPEAMDGTAGQGSDPGTALLAATARRAGLSQWSTTLLARADTDRSIEEQFSDEELTRLYRESRTHEIGGPLAAEDRGFEPSGREGEGDS
ncbi:MAG: hypothetical protein KY464_16240 [Gemmatimonadetes bacterium]|nr:hypothetical protein [Gemmatimonadota bacterium]